MVSIYNAFFMQKLIFAEVPLLRFEVFENQCVSYLLQWHPDLENVKCQMFLLSRDKYKDFEI